MSLEMWSQVRKLEDGESLDAKTLNGPVSQLGERTDWLYARLKKWIDTGVMSSVIIPDVDLDNEEGRVPERGNVVYLDNDSGKFKLAKATMHLYDDFTAADSAFTIGILMSKSGMKGDVLAYGKLNLNPTGSPIIVSNMIESTETFRPGRYYLSANEAGRLSRHPNGPLIYVCTIEGETNEISGGFESGMAIVTPQFLDIGTSHVHRSAVLTAMPAGTSSIDGYAPEGFEDSDTAPKLRFGGTWTDDRDDRTVTYEFWIDEGGGSWPNGVELRWTEDGHRSNEFVAKIKGPDEEVSISHGLTARLSLPQSTSTKAYDGQAGWRWSPLEFPKAGRGWLAHEARSVASFGDIKVAVRGKFNAVNTTVNIAFPASIQNIRVSSIIEGSTFEYNGNTFQFTHDVEHFDMDGAIPVRLGTTDADSALYLIEEIKKSDSSNSSQEYPSSRYAVYESDAVTRILIMDGASVEGNQDIVYEMSTVSCSSFDIPGSNAAKAVVFDGNGLVLGSQEIVNDVYPYVWKEIGEDVGDLAIIVYQSSDITQTVQTGTLATTTVTDFEPDAIYDYVIGMDPQIANYWPPIPPKSAALIVNGVEMDNKALLPKNPTVSFCADTIHWFEDDEGRRPWPDAFEGRDVPVSPELDKTEVLTWVRGFQCASGPVTSIQVRDGSPLRIYGYGTNDKANTGDLEISADFDFNIVSKGISGFNVPKRARNGNLEAGPIVERVIGGAGIQVVSQAGCPEGQGTVIVALEDGSYRNQFSDIALENAEQAKIGMFPYVRLKGYSNNTITSPSAFTATMRVPTNMPNGEYALMVKASVFGEVGFEGARKTARVKLAYNILPDYVGGMAYSNLKTGLLKPDSERIVDITFGHDSSRGVKYDGFDPIVVMTKGLQDDDGEEDIVQRVLGSHIPSAANFGLQDRVHPELRPGYLVGIRFSRAVSEGDNPYTAAIGFINLSWTLVAFN